MKLVFCGTPEFAVPSLDALLAAGHTVELVLTQPDRPAGRGLTVQVPPVKRLAIERGLSVLQPEKIRNNEDLRSRLEAIAPDAIVVVAYGRIIPAWMLRLPRFGNLNVHASLLPKYRGAAPIQWAVANGETQTGVSIMQLDEGLDTGDVFVKAPLAIGPEARATDLFPQLAALGARELTAVLEALQDGTIAAVPQQHELATQAPVLTREDGRMLPGSRSAAEIFNRWRGFHPWPGSHGLLRGKRFLVHEMRLQVEATDLAAGELRVMDGVLRMGTAGGGAVELLEVQMEGKPRLPGVQFMRDFQVKPGEIVG